MKASEKTIKWRAKAKRILWVALTLLWIVFCVLNLEHKEYIGWDVNYFHVSMIVYLLVFFGVSYVINNTEIID